MDHALITSTLTSILDHLGLPHDGCTITKEGEITRVEIHSKEPSRLIGWHGETLNSLQHLLKSIIRSLEKLERTPFILLEIDGYRKMQEDKVRRIAEQKADFVRRTGTRIALQPMSPYFRRIVHTHVTTSPLLQDLSTESIGEGDYRQIVLKLKDEKDARLKTGEELTPTMLPADAQDGLENLDI